jgi:UDP-4-amino-4,6-dideoxy-N-acetyl-beta-L-altrosamine N-acetyltransferase
MMFEKCSIRDLVEEDLTMVLRWRNQPGVRKFMFTQHEINIKEHAAWFERVSQDPQYRIMIVEEDGVPIGYVQFSDVTVGGIASWGFYASTDAPKGSGRKLGTTALSYAFDVLKVHKVCGQVITVNEVSAAFHKRMGFKQEGILRDQKIIGDEYHSLICFGLLEAEWRASQILEET